MSMLGGVGSDVTLDAIRKNLGEYARRCRI